MSIKNILVTSTVIIFSIENFSCEEDIYKTDLTDSFLTVQDTSTVDISMISYQVPPQLGGMNRLNLGSINRFDIPFILMKPGNLDFLNDSLINIDSAYFQISLDTTANDSVDVNTRFVLGFIEADSSYSENKTNHTNVGWIPDNYSQLQDSIAEDSLSNQFLKFNIGTSRIIAWADSSNPDSMFILKPVEGTLEGLLTFYSSESTDQPPFIKIFYHINPDADSDTSAVSIDTSATVSISSDISLIKPPGLTDEIFDSTRAYVSIGGGIRSLVSINFDSLNIPKEAVVIKAYMEFYPDTVTSRFLDKNDFAVQMFALTDSTADWSWGQIFLEDSYSHGASSDKSSVITSLNGTVFRVNLKNIAQSLVMNRFDNFDFKLLPVNSGSVYEYMSFFTEKADTLVPALKILYEVP